ncbi:MAG: class I SAM-dependent methyltransferase [bacterium]|nr:class I SAM-dependent methyltransferase [bacterium]
MTKKAMSIEEQLGIIQEAYDGTVEDYLNGIRDEDILPEKFMNSPEYKKFIKAEHLCNSGEIEIKAFLDPQIGMKFLDVGSCANLIGYGLYKWDSIYYGVDFSSELLKVTKKFTRKNNIEIGGLYAADASDLPFENEFFDTAAILGVLEYYDIEYIEKVLIELHRVIKSEGKIVIDFPNPNHPDVNTMIELENYLGRPRFNLPCIEEFEKALDLYFQTVEIDRNNLMIRYNCICKK